LLGSLRVLAANFALDTYIVDDDIIFIPQWGNEELVPEGSSIGSIVEETDRGINPWNIEPSKVLAVNIQTLFRSEQHRALSVGDNRR